MSATALLALIGAPLALVLLWFVFRLERGASPQGEEEVAPVSARPISPEALVRVREQLADGHKIAAIATWRQATGAGLAESKTAVEALMAGRAPADDHRSTGSSNLEREIMGLLAAGNTIEAIKRWREETGCSLLEAKQAIDSRRGT